MSYNTNQKVFMGDQVQAGLMSGDDIKTAHDNHELLIVPYNKDNLTPVGYNFSYSNFIISLKTGQFHKIYNEDLKNDKGLIEHQLCFYIKPNETVLILTREAICVPNNIGGTFHSKVSVVADGLSHVSTTLDPGWSGQLLIPMNNPTKEKIRVPIGTLESATALTKFKSFITLVLFRTISPSEETKSDNKSNRYELLEKTYINGKSKDKTILRAIQRMRRKIEQFDEDCIVNPDINKPVEFKKLYKQLTIDSDTEYDNIIQIADKQRKRAKLCFGLIVFGMICLLGSILFLGFKYPSFQWLAPTLAAMLTSVAIVLIKPIKDKVLG